MTVPDELVQAGAEAPCVHTGSTRCDERSLFKHPRCVLQAAFAKLPECEEVVKVMDNAMDHGVPAPGGERLRMVKQALAALAREFGGQDG